ncbi:MAG: translation initiation factor IF-2 subunit alpha [archaeon]
MYNYKDFPEVDEYVIVTITNINPNSAFAKLDEYQNKVGMIHISEVASTWIRDIRKYLSVGNKKVAKVLSVDRAKGYINLSIKRVKPTVERDKKTEWKNEKKAENLFSMVAKNMELKLDDAYAKTGFELQKKYGLLYGVFELAATEGASALIKDGVDEAWAKALEDVAKKNLKPKEVTVTGILEIISYKSDGIEVIKNGIAQLDDEHVKVVYLNAPKYQIKATARDYIECERILKEGTGKIIEYITRNGGEAVLKREK